MLWIKKSNESGYKKNNGSDRLKYISDIPKKSWLEKR